MITMVEGLTKHAYNQESQIDKLIGKMNDLLDGESNMYLESY